MEDDEILEEEQEEVKEENESKANSTPSFKDIVITECKRIINQYKELMSKSDDWKLLEGFNNPNKNDDECVNHIMNNLTKKLIYGGADSLMYEYIHEYYVDDLKEEQLKDNWSSCMRPTSVPEKPKAELTEEQKQKLIKKAEEDFLKEQKRKLEQEEQERIKREKEQERIRKEKELEKKKAEEEKKAKALEEAKQSGAAEQMSIFDF